MNFTKPVLRIKKNNLFYGLLKHVETKGSGNPSFFGPNIVCTDDEIFVGEVTVHI